MFADLPTPIQQKILSYLATDNFRAAKELHDDFILKNKQRCHDKDADCDDEIED